VSVLSIVQTNQFKHLTHLSLQLRQGTDATIKRVLAARLALSKAAHADAEAQLSAARAEGARLAQIASVTSEELVRARSEAEARVAAQVASSLIERSEERAWAQAERADAEAAFRRISYEQQQHQQRELSVAQSAALSARTELHSALETVASLERSVQEALATEAKLRNEASDQSEELSRLRAARSEASSVGEKVARELSTLQTRCAVLEQQVLDQRELLVTAQQQLSAAESLKSRLYEDLSLYKQLYEKNQDKLERSVREIEKGNVLIARLDDAARSKAESLRVAEERLADRERTALSLQRECDALRGSLEREREARAASESALEQARAHLRQARDTVASNEKVIAWLNTELADQASGRSVQQKQLLPSIGRVPLTTSPQVRTSVSASTVRRFDAAAPMDSLGVSSTQAAESAARTACDQGLSSLLPKSCSDASTSDDLSAAASNPYLAGTVPLADVLHRIKLGGLALTAHAADTSNGVPGGGR
jgi:spindle assembly abnormal protein 6